MREYIPKKIRQSVVERANNSCEYCKLNQEFSFLPFQLEHIVSIKHGGGNEIENLALACAHCNAQKGTDLTTFLNDYEDIVPLYHPRKENWEKHFSTSKGLIIPVTRIGKATVKLLLLNNPERVAIRKILAEVGLYP